MFAVASTDGEARPAGEEGSSSPGNLRAYVEEWGALLRRADRLVPLGRALGESQLVRLADLELRLIPEGYIGLRENGNASKPKGENLAARPPSNRSGLADVSPGDLAALALDVFEDYVRCREERHAEVEALRRWGNPDRPTGERLVALGQEVGRLSTQLSLAWRELQRSDGDFRRAVEEASTEDLARLARHLRGKADRPDYRAQHYYRLAIERRLEVVEDILRRRG